MNKPFKERMAEMRDFLKTEKNKLLKKRIGNLFEEDNTPEETTQELKRHNDDPDEMTQELKRHKDSPLPLIPTSTEKPPYYTPIDIWYDGQLYKNWRRVSNGIEDFYGSDDTPRILFPEEVKWWAKREGVTYPKYDPFTKDDIKEFTRRDINDVIKALTKLINIRKNNSALPYIDYVTGVDDAIITVRKLLNLDV